MWLIIGAWPVDRLWDISGWATQRKSGEGRRRAEEKQAAAEATHAQVFSQGAVLDDTSGAAQIDEVAASMRAGHGRDTGRVLLSGGAGAQDRSGGGRMSSGELRKVLGEGVAQAPVGSGEGGQMQPKEGGQKGKEELLELLPTVRQQERMWAVASYTTPRLDKSGQTLRDGSRPGPGRA